MGICLLPLIIEETDKPGGQADLKSQDEPQILDVTEPVGNRPWTLASTEISIPITLIFIP